MPRYGMRIMSGSIDATVREVFGFLREPAHLFAALNYGDPPTEIHYLKTTPDGVGTTARVVFPLPVFGRLGATVQMINEIADIVEGRRIAVKSSTPATGIMKAPIVGPLFQVEATWTWAFEPQDGRTRLDVDFAGTGGWLVWLFDKLTERLQTRGFGKAVKAYVESGIQARPSSPDGQ